MKNATEQLSTYKSLHLSRKNLVTHFVGVPAIIWSLALFLSLYQWSWMVADYQLQLTPAIVFFGLVTIYYFWLNWQLAIGMIGFSLLVLYTCHLVNHLQSAHWIALAVFAVAWVIQFIGHYYEKAKPAFFDDINQLLIGPFFLMAEIYFALGWLKPLEQQITPLAIQKRREYETAQRI